MVDSASGSKILSGSGIYDFSAESKRLVVENIMRNMELEGNLSDAEIKFLSLSKEKKSYAKLFDNILSSELNINNYEEIFYLQDYTAFTGTINPEQAVRNIRYKDRFGRIVAIVQIDTLSKKIRMQNIGDILPKQECFSPKEVGIKIQNLAKFKKWTTEDGGRNQFNGNIETRYKKDGVVMASIITKDNGVFDTIAEYEYKNGNRSKMLLTNTNGNSIVIYDGTNNVNQTARIDIDNNGSIIEITKVYND